MGKFIGIIAAALDMRDGQFLQTTELLDFPDEVWVYYCRPHLGPPRPGWSDLAAGTLRVSLQPEPFRFDRIEWQPDVRRDETTGAWEYAAEVMGVEPGNNVFHLALPAGMLPVVGSWDIAPLYGHADADRFVVGWSIVWNANSQVNQWPTFRFALATPDEFKERADEIGRAIGRAAREQRQTLLMPTQVPAGEMDKISLLDRLGRTLDLEGVRTLAFEIGVDYDDLAGDTKTGKLRELILYMERQDQLPRLVAHLRGRYPQVLRQ